MSINWKIFTFTIAIGFSFILRFWAASQGENYDMLMWNLIARFIDSGDNFYHTGKAVWGPPFPYLLWISYRIAHFFHQPEYFRYLVSLFISLGDLLIAVILYRQFKWWSGILFILNPIVILISGYSGQFHTLAILFAILAMAIYDRAQQKKQTKYQILSLILLGISLSVEHIFIFFPLWMFFKRLNFKNLKLIIIPWITWIILFIPWMIDDFQIIWEKIFLYRSYTNYPLFSWLMPGLKNNPTSAFPIFVSLILYIGWQFRKTNISNPKLAIWYTATIVIVSSSVEFHYLAIATLFTSVFPNIFLILHTLLSTYIIIRHTYGLNWWDPTPYSHDPLAPRPDEPLAKIIGVSPSDDILISIAVLLLAVGSLWTILNKNPHTQEILNQGLYNYIKRKIKT